MADEIGVVRERLAAARAVVVLTGAGISADSGVPTFRGQGPGSGPGSRKNGLWRQYRAEDLATPEAFARDPHLVWEWYAWRRGLIAACQPNPAHHALVRLEQQCQAFTLITQNVDGLHGKAGSRGLIELHGNIWRVRCIQCGTVAFNGDVPIPVPPSCTRGAGPARCGGLLRPNVVWFGESLDAGDLARSIAAIQTAEVVLIIGTSGIVQPAASFAAHARAAGAYVVEVNLERPPFGVTSADVTLIGRAAEVIPRLVGDL